MAIRVNKLLTELNIGLQTLDDTLKALGYKEEFLTPNSKIPDDIAILVRGYFSEGADFLKVVKAAAENGVYGHKDETHPLLKVVGRIDLDALATSKNSNKDDRPKHPINPIDVTPLNYSEK